MIYMFKEEWEIVPTWYEGGVDHDKHVERKGDMHIMTP